MGKLRALIELPGRAVGKVWSLTPWAKAAAKEEAEKAAIQAARRAEIEAMGEGAVDIAKQTTKTSGSTYGKVGRTVVSIAIGVGVGLLLPGVGFAGQLIISTVIESGGEAAVGVLTAPATEKPEPTEAPEEVAEPAPAAPSRPSGSTSSGPARTAAPTQQPGGVVVVHGDSSGSTGDSGDVHEGTSSSSNSSSSSSDNDHEDDDHDDPHEEDPHSGGGTSGGH